MQGGQVEQRLARVQVRQVVQVEVRERQRVAVVPVLDRDDQRAVPRRQLAQQRAGARRAVKRRLTAHVQEDRPVGRAEVRLVHVEPLVEAPRVVGVEVVEPLREPARRLRLRPERQRGRRARWQHVATHGSREPREEQQRLERGMSSHAFLSALPGGAPRYQTWWAIAAQ